MRRFLLVLVILAALVVGAALILPSLVPADTWRGRIETAASEALGREVTIEGDIAFSILPKVQARAGTVAIANEEGFGEAPFASMEELRLSLQLMPLLRREFVIEEFVLVDPLIRLEQRGDRNNWSFGSGENAPAPTSQGFRRPGALPLEASFGDVRLVDGTLIYASGADERRFEDVDLTLDLPSLDAPMGLRGAFTLDGQRLDLTAGLGSLRAFFEGGRTPLELSLTGPIGDIGFDGHVLESNELEYEGMADLDLALPRLAALFGASLPEGEAFQRLAANGRLVGSPGQMSVSDAAIALDETQATGNLTFDYAGQRPALDARVDIAELDLNPYMPQREEAGSGGGLGPWSDERIDLSALDLFDARVRGQVARLIVNEIEVSDAALDAVLDRSRLEANFTGFRLYGGRGTARLVANNRTQVPSYAFAGQLETLEALPFLQAAADFDRLRGLGTLGLDVSGSGTSMAAVMNSLSGQGAFDFSDGAIVGVNLARLIRGVLTALETRQLPDAFGEQQETDFSALRGTINIANGVARNQDLTMLGPLVRVAGQGAVDLGAQRLDYRLTPRAVASLTGQGGETDLQGIPVPILISGSFAEPSVSLDFAAIARSLVQARAQGQLGDLGQVLDLNRVREQGAAGILSILTGSQSQPAPAEGDTSGETAEPQEEPSEAERVEGLFRDILGAATRPRQQEEEEQPADEEEEAGGSAPNR